MHESTSAMSVTIICDDAAHRRPLVRFRRDALDTPWTADRGSWEIETRGTDVLHESFSVDSMGRRVRNRTMLPPRDRWRIWCKACERTNHPRSLVITSRKLDAAVSQVAALGHESVTLDTLRGVAPKSP